MPPATRKVNGASKPPTPPPPKPPVKVVFKSDLPLEQAAYEGTVKVLGYAPLIHPYIDPEHDEVYAKHERNIEALRQLSKE